MRSIIAKKVLYTLMLLFAICSNGNAGTGKPASPLPLVKKIKLDFSVYKEINTAFDNQLEQSFADLTALIENNVSNRKYKRTMLHFMRILKLKRALRNEKFKTKFYDDLASISAKLKLYPIAMQLRYQQMQDNNFISLLDTTETKISEDNTALNELDSSFLNTETPSLKKSKPIQTSEILQSFDDGKEATDYALIIHVKQPKPGKRTSFTGIDNVGHTFITLIKYNNDQTYVSRSFGFYPDKNSLLAASPIHPTTPSTFKDDALHDWDEAVGKFISYRRFVKIIKILTRYEYKSYDLNENNCTDFGLSIAALSGIQISETTGTWPLGKGNNPANIGQSILENKIADELTGDNPNIFVFKK